MYKRWVSVKNEKNGIEFEYTSNYFKNPARIPRRRLSLTTINNPAAKFNNGITISKSTREHVLYEFGGMPEGWKNTKYVKYKEKGVAFRFDDKDLLVEVEIFGKNN